MALSSMLTTSSNTRRPFGNPAASPAQQAERVRIRRRRRDRDVQPHHVRLDRAGVVLEPRDDPAGDPGEQDRHQVGPLRLSARRGSGRRRGRGPAAASPAPGARRTSANFLSSAGCTRVPLVLLAHRHDDLVEQRVAEPGDLDPGPGLRRARPWPGRAAAPCAGSPRPRSPAPPWRCSGRSGPSRRGSVPDRHLDRDRVHVERRRRVDPHRRGRRRSGAGSGMGAGRRGRRSTPGRRRTPRFAGRRTPSSPASSECTAGFASVAVVRRRAGPDVARRAAQVAGRSPWTSRLCR